MSLAKKRCFKIKEVELIIFDLDGTLIDSRKDIANAVNFTLKELGLEEKDMLEIASYIGAGVEDLIRKSLGDKTRDAVFTRALYIFQKYYRKHFTDNSYLYPGVIETLEYFKNKRKAIITNRKYEFAVLALKALYIADYFEDILGGDDLGCVKPSSCPLDKTIYKLNADRARTIIVGDMDIDILAGKSADIITCAVSYGIGRKEDILKAKPDFIIDSLLELKGIIN